MSEAWDFGKYYYGIDRPTGLQMVFADEIKVDEDGNLFLLYYRDDKPLISMVLPKGQWKEIFSASMLDGREICVDNFYLHKKDGGEKSKAAFIKNERSKMTLKLRMQVLKRDGYKCKCCGLSKDEGAILEIDHIIPIAKGGTTEMNNLQTLCYSCNHGKSTDYL